MGGHRGEVPVLATPEATEPATSSAVEGEARLAKLVHLYFDFIWRLVRRLGVSEAEDATQQVFTIAWKKLAEIDADKERSFLVGIAVRVASEQRRTRRRRREVDEEPPDIPASTPDASELLDQLQARRILDDILAVLSLELREAFVLFEIEQLTMREMAEVLEVPSGTVASRLRRAREAFAAELGHRRAFATNKEEP